MKPRLANFRFYEELNDFLSPEHRKQTIAWQFAGKPTVGEAIEAFGVPPGEVDLILVNDASVGLRYRLRNGDRVAVYPVFERFDISVLQRLRPVPLRKTAFIVDARLGELARRLRVLGFDTDCDDHLQGREIIDIAAREKRILLTPNRGLLAHDAVTHGLCITATDADTQLEEVLTRLDLYDQARPRQRGEK